MEKKLKKIQITTHVKQIIDNSLLKYTFNLELNFIFKI